MNTEEVAPGGSFQHTAVDSGLFKEGRDTILFLEIIKILLRNTSWNYSEPHV